MELATNGGVSRVNQRSGPQDRSVLGEEAQGRWLLGRVLNMAWGLKKLPGGVPGQNVDELGLLDWRAVIVCRSMPWR